MTKISQLVDLGANLAAGDEFVVRDVSDISTPNKKVTSSGLIDYVIAQGSVSGFTQIAAGAGPQSRVQCTSSGSTHEIIFTTSATERLRIDSSGRLLVGTSTTRSNLFAGNAALPAYHLVEGALDNGRRASAFVYGAGSNSGPLLVLAAHGSNSVGGVTAVTNGWEVGTIDFQGADGTNFVPAARIAALVDGTPGANDMPGRLVFSTTSDSASSPTERMRITSTGQVRLAGAGITFNGDTAAANELDDYEEGTWTPVVTNMTTTGSPAYGGRYRKIGSQVTVWFFTTTLGGVATYTATANSTFVVGLPFNSGYDGPNPAGGPPGVAVNGNTTAGGFLQGPSNSSTTFYFDTTIASTQGLSASLTYYV